jgi:hypothetical protein
MDRMRTPSLPLAVALALSCSHARGEEAKLTVEGPDDAAVHLDGQLVAITPLEEPLTIAPGSHFVAITLDGHHPETRTIEVAAGETATVAVDLEATGQRIGAGILLGVGAGGIVAGLVLGVLSVVEHRESQDLFDDVGALGPSPSQRQAYGETIERRDDFRLGSGLAAGFGLGLFVVGGALFVLDRPEAPAAPERAALTPAIIPQLGPGFAGAEIRTGF